ncbi:hypothetical protein BDR26DRAFT_869393 [Obelidium mucronatum]|nr:hypothetical protein BDR26DRAFT_869393 [Obelidium mucronatum]
MQEAISEDLVKMAERLKANSLMFGDSLARDKEVMADAEHKLDANVQTITRQGSKLEKVLATTRGNCWLTVFAVVGVCLLFVFAFVWMKLFSVVKT